MAALPAAAATPIGSTASPVRMERSNGEVRPMGLHPTPVTAVAAPLLAIERLKSINLLKFRTSELSGKAWLWMLLPGIGWIGLVFYKISLMRSHRAAEKEMKSFVLHQTSSFYMSVVSDAIKAAGSLAWQYRLELARLHLLKGESELAVEQLRLAAKQRGKESSVLVKVKLVTSPTSGTLRMEKLWKTREETLLNIFAFVGDLEAAYDACNQGLAFQTDTSDFRAMQEEVVKMMREPGARIGQLGISILSAENQLLERQQYDKTSFEHRLAAAQRLPGSPVVVS